MYIHMQVFQRERIRERERAREREITHATKEEATATRRAWSSAYTYKHIHI